MNYSVFVYLENVPARNQPRLRIFSTPRYVAWYPKSIIVYYPISSDGFRMSCKVNYTSCALSVACIIPPPPPRRKMTNEMFQKNAAQFAVAATPSPSQESLTSQFTLLDQHQPRVGLDVDGHGVLHPGDGGPRLAARLADEHDVAPLLDDLHGGVLQDLGEAARHLLVCKNDENGSWSRFLNSNSNHSYFT